MSRVAIVPIVLCAACTTPQPILGVDARASDVGALDAAVTDAPLDDAPSRIDDAAPATDAPSFVNRCSAFPGATVATATTGVDYAPAITLGDAGDGRSLYSLVFTTPPTARMENGSAESASPSVVNRPGRVNISTSACDFDGVDAVVSRSNAVANVSFTVGAPSTWAAVLEPGRTYALNVVVDEVPPTVVCGPLGPCNWLIELRWPDM